MKGDDAFPIFVGTLIVLAIATGLFYRRASLEAKRRWHPWFAFGSAGLFAFFVVLVMGCRILFFVVPLAFLCGFLSWKFTKFCPGCGRMIQNPAPWSRIAFCPRCGARLDGSSEPPNRPLQPRASGRG
jgi:hypothetical protein